jgi:hypothetical protein
MTVPAWLAFVLHVWPKKGSRIGSDQISLLMRNNSYKDATKGRYMTFELRDWQ